MVIKAYSSLTETSRSAKRNQSSKRLNRKNLLLIRERVDAIESRRMIMIHNVFLITPSGEPIFTVKLGSIESPEAKVGVFISAIQVSPTKILEDISTNSPSRLVFFSCNVPVTTSLSLPQNKQLGG